MTTRTLIHTLALMVATATTVLAQTDTILPNPKLVKLHRIWLQMGTISHADERVGSGAGGVGFINSDSLEDFAVAFDKLGQWRVYFGKGAVPDTLPAWTFDSSGGFPPHPVVGDFWGTGHKAIGFMRGRLEGPTLSAHYWLHIFRTDSGRIADTASLIWNSWTSDTPARKPYPTDIIAADLDGDHADEMIVIAGAVGTSNNAEIWIYRGGANFQVDTPTVVIRDAEANSDEFSYGAAAADIDGDGRTDLIVWGDYPGNLSKVHFFWGRDGSPWNWSTPDRTIELTAGYPALYPGITILDCDGDHRMDFMVGNYLFRSASGKDTRSRAYSIADADSRFFRYGYYTASSSPGYLNDTSRRYQMLLLHTGGDNATGSDGMFFSGGENGPNHTYDAYYRPEDDGLLGGFVFGYKSMSPLHDCNDDGWDDFITGDGGYGLFNSGIALVLAGGPYIPNDDPTVSVEEITIEQHHNGLSLWPNPARDELNIAWRGDLHRMPSRFEVHDLLGKLVASGTVEPQLGAATWHCAEVPAGVYLLTAFDHNGNVIAQTTLLKQ